MDHSALFISLKILVVFCLSLLDNPSSKHSLPYEKLFGSTISPKGPSTSTVNRLSIVTSAGRSSIKPSYLVFYAGLILGCGDIQPHPGPQQYSSKQLRNLYPKRAKLDSNTWNTLTELEILKPYRGCRAGVRKRRLWTNLNTLGIRKPVRGIRAGQKVRLSQKHHTSLTPSTKPTLASTIAQSIEFKQIPTITTTTNSTGNLQHTSMGINRNNLIAIPLMKSTPTLALMNCQSIRNKTTAVMDHILEHKVDIAVLTETWLQAGNRDLAVIGELELPGYKLHHRPRQHRGGGVGVLINTVFKVKPQVCPFYSSFECMRLSIQIKSICIHLLVIYRVPPSKKNKILSTDFIEQFAELLDTLVTLKGKFIIAGDFNIHWDKSNDESKERKELDILLKTYGLHQHVSKPTHTKGHTIDLIITRDDDNCVVSTVVDELISDHNAVHCSLQCATPHPDKKIVQFRKLKSLNPDELNKSVSETALCTTPIDNFINLDDLITQYQRDLTTVLDTLAPLKTKSFVERPLIPWINQDILLSKTRKRKLEKLWRKTNLTVHYEMYRSEKQNMQSLIDKAKTGHYKAKIEECSGNQGSIFKIIAHLQNIKAKPTLPTHENIKNLCDTFNDFFVSKIVNIRNGLDQITLSNDLVSESGPAFCGDSLTCWQEIATDELAEIMKSSSNATCETDPVPTKFVKTCLFDTLLPIICKIVNLSLNFGSFPDFFKCALVKPLLKKITLDPDILKNYRPVSNLTFISKLIEKVVAKQITTHFKKHNLLEKFQSAYRPLHSTETALLRVSNDILRAVDDKRCVFLVLLDLSAAFDTIDHSILLKRLKRQLGVNGTALQWFESYLTCRTQCILIDGEKSSSKQLTCGVPQGSVLGPLLFSAYLSELGHVIREYDMSFHTYADDTQIYIAFKPDEADITIQRLEQCITKIRTWMIESKLKLNDDKSEFILISSPHNKKKFDNLSIHIGPEIVSATNSVRNLGFMMDSVFNMEDHITSVCRSCYFHLRNIGTIRRYLDNDTAAQIIHAFVTSRLDYCNSLLSGLPKYLVARLIKVQNTAVRIIKLCDVQDNITPHLKNLHWLPIPLRIDFKLLLMTYKIVNDLAPSYLCDLLAPRELPRELRSSSMGILEVPRSRTTTYGDRAFSIAAPQLWNELPHDVKSAPTLPLFKTKLKTHLFDKF